MLKFKSRKDAPTIILFILGILLSTFGVLGGLFITYLFSDGITIIMALLFVGISGAALAALVCNAVRTEYTFYDDIFEVTGGFSRKQFVYKQIYALQRTKKIFCLNALAREKFEIIYRGDGPKVYISPENEEVFLKELKKHCKNLQIRDYQ
jgi:hypothetical protein